MPKDLTQPGPETRNGLSLARNDAFATITRSLLPPCAFVSTPEISTNSFDQQLFRSVRFRSRNRANSTPPTRYPQVSPPLP